MQNFVSRPFLILTILVSLAGCSAITEFDRSRIGATDGGDDADADANTDAMADASVSCLGIDCSALDDECVMGVCRDGTCFAEPRPDGTTCDDGLTCTENDVCDGSGQCGGTTRSCDDGLPCTTDTCDEQDGCQNELGAGSCLIEGSCYADEELHPSNDCQWCASEIKNSAWTNRSLGSSCSDGLFCTDVDQCDGEGTCEGTSRDCSDNNLCNVDACDEDADECTHMASDDNCNIDSTCVARGVKNPTNSCQVCDPDTSLTEWTNLAEGVTCSDGDACTLDDKCNDSATCVPGAAKSCDDSLSCTSDSCDPGNGQCNNALSNKKCLIGNVCYNDNQGRAGFPCQRCEASTPTQWSHRAETTPCEDGDACTTNDQCDDSGGCLGGAPPNCDDGNECTLNGCDSGAGCTTQDLSLGFGCNDDNMCTMNDQCDGSGNCGGADVTCTDDGNECTIEMCDPDLGCVSMDAPITMDCEDGDMCTTGSKCDGNGSCAPGTPVSCTQDGNECTVHVCDSADGVCKPDPEPDTKACDDGDTCTDPDFCDGAGSCAGGPNVCADAGVDSGP